MNPDIFNKELIQILDEEVKELILEILHITPDSYETLPSSTSGKYHPVDELSKGGLILHVKKCFRLGIEAARRYDLKGLELDIVKAACLIHDFPHRYEKNGKGVKTDYTHPFKNAYEIWKRYHNPLLLPLIGAIFYHMGRWADYSCTEAKILRDLVFRLSKHPIILAVQEADYYSSRRFISIGLEDRRILNPLEIFKKGDKL